MKRILHIIGKMDRAGAETMLMNLYRNIDRTQIQFDFLVFESDEGDYDNEIEALGGKVHRLVATNPIFRMLKLSKFLATHEGYQIVHAHMLLNNAFHLLASKMAGVKHRISHSHSTSNKVHPNLIDKIYEKWSIAVNNQLSTYPIACGLEAGKYLFPGREDVYLLPNAIDVRLAADLAKKNRNYITDNYHYSGLKIVQIGRFLSVKNHQFTIKLAAYLQEKGVNVKFFLIGQGAMEKELQKEVKEKGLAKVVMFLGLRADILELMAGADVMIMPSLHEGFPVVLVESQSVGLPAIVSDTVSPEVDLGLGLVRFNSLSASLESWSKLLLDSVMCCRPLAEDRIRELAVRGFDVKENANTLKTIYKSMT